MNFKTTYILFGVLLVVVIIAAFGLIPERKASDELRVMNDLAEFKVNTADIDTLEIERHGDQPEKLVFVKDPDANRWKMVEPKQLRVDRFVVDGVINDLAGARKEEADLTRNLSQWGLDSPAVVVRLHKGNEQEWWLKLGNQSGGGSGAVVYAVSSGRPNDPVAVARSKVESVYKSVNAFRSKDLLAEGVINLADATQSVKLQEPKKDPIELKKTAEGTWRFEKPALGAADTEGESPGGFSPEPKPTVSGVKDLVGAISNIRVESDQDFVSDDPKDFAKYGVETDKPDRLRIEITRSADTGFGSEQKKPPVTEALLIGKKVEDKGEKKADDKGEKKTDDKAGKYYARLENENAVVKVPAKSLDTIFKVVEKPELIRNRDLVQIDQNKADAIDIRNAEGLVKLRKAGDFAGWKIFDAAGKAAEADTTAVQALLKALTAKRQVKEFPPADKSLADLGFDKPTATVTIWVDGIQKEEKKEEKKEAEKPKDEKKDEKKDDKAKDAAKKDKKDDKGKDEKKEDKKETVKETVAEPKLKDKDKPTVKLVFGKRDKEVVYVLREAGGETTRLAVPATLLTRVEEGRLAYLDKSLPSFPFNADLSKLVLTRGNQTFELDSEKKDDKSPTTWKIKQPAELAGRTADTNKVGNILRELQGLQANKLIAEKASDTELERYGLKSPRVKATVTVKTGDKKTEDRVYLFGNETEDKSGVYAKQGDRDWVFTVRPGIVTTLQSDLPDQRIFTFDPAKVTQVKLTGWKKATGFVVNLTAERKSGSKTWTATEAPKGFELAGVQVDSLVNQLSNLTAERFVVFKAGPKAEHELGADTRDLNIEFQVEGEKAPLTLTIGKLDKEQKGYFAQSSTLPGDVFLVAQDRFEKLLGGIKFFGK